MGDWLDANMSWFGWIIGIVIAILYVAATRHRTMRLWKHALAIIAIGVIVGLGLGVVADVVD